MDISKVQELTGLPFEDSRALLSQLIKIKNNQNNNLNTKSLNEEWLKNFKEESGFDVRGAPSPLVEKGVDINLTRDERNIVNSGALSGSNANFVQNPETGELQFAFIPDELSEAFLFSKTPEGQIKIVKYPIDTTQGANRLGAKGVPVSNRSFFTQHLNNVSFKQDPRAHTVATVRPILKYIDGIVEFKMVSGGRGKPRVPQIINSKTGEIVNEGPLRQLAIKAKQMKARLDALAPRGTRAKTRADRQTLLEKGRPDAFDQEEAVNLILDATDTFHSSLLGNAIRGKI